MSSLIFLHSFFCLLLAGIYFPVLTNLINQGWNREDYTYASLIPVIIGYLIWDNRKAFMAVEATPSWLGLLLLLPGVTMFWLGELGGDYFTMYLSLTMTVIALCWTTMGWRKLKTVLFALLFSLAMYPPPFFLHNKITFNLKLISSELGVWMLHLYGMSAYREGNVIDLGFTQLQVVDACSGLRYLFPLAILAILMAYFYKASLWKRIALVLSTVPLTLLTNSFRIALTGILYQFWGPVVAEGFFHSFSGWFIFMFGLILLLVEMWMFNSFRFDKLICVHSTTNGTNRNPPNDSNLTQRPATGRRSGLPPQGIFAALILIATLVVSSSVEFQQKVPSAKSFVEFPVQIGKWDGRSEEMEQRFIDELDLTDYVLVNYRNNVGQQVNFYTAYYQSQAKGQSIHSPASCLPGAGWVFEEAETITLPVRSRKGEDLSVNRAFMVKDDVRQLSYYWFPQRDRILTNRYQLKWYNFLDALTRQRTDGALVRLITPVYPSEEVGGADARLVGFAREVVPVLGQFLPE